LKPWARKEEEMDGARQVARVAISAVVTRADGTVEDLGVVSYGDADPVVAGRIGERLARGERVDELEVIPHGEMLPFGSVSFRGPAIGE
jgi:hypothetical protein